MARGRSGQLGYNGVSPGMSGGAAAGTGEASVVQPVLTRDSVLVTVRLDDTRQPRAICLGPFCGERWSG